MSTKKVYAAFVAVIPTVLLGCVQPEKKELHRNPPPPDDVQLPPQMRIGNPPEPASTSTLPVPAPVVSAPEPRGTSSIALTVPPVSYGPRKVRGSGDCYVNISGNPPQQRPVSCTAPIEPPVSGGGTWCSVASAEDPKKKISVACEGDEMKK